MAQAMTTFCPEKWYQRWSSSLWGSPYIHHGVVSYFCNICDMISTEIIHENKDLISHALYFPSQGKMLEDLTTGPETEHRSDSHGNK